MDLNNLTKQELEIRFKMITELYKQYEQIKASCENCTNWNKSVKICTPWGQVPEHVQKEGCSEWRYDAIPF